MLVLLFGHGVLFAVVVVAVVVVLPVVGAPFVGAVAGGAVPVLLVPLVDEFDGFELVDGVAAFCAVPLVCVCVGVPVAAFGQFVVLGVVGAGPGDV